MTKHGFAVLYALSALAIVAVLSLLHPSASLIGWYWCASFWALVGFDGYLTLVKEEKVSARWSFEDRFIGYIFAAPFVLPARAYALSRVCASR